MKLRLAEERTLRVLVVEDDRDFAGCLIDALHDDGCDVAHAETGAEAIRIAMQQSPQAVLLDLRLPDGNGLDVARALRAECLEQHAAIVVLTAAGPDELRASADIDLLLTKPTDADKLGSLLRHLRSHRVRPSV